MNTKGCVAMILAGGRGMKLGALTHFYSKPAIYFGGNSRIIDFTLNNCYTAGIETIGILSQHFTMDLHAYVSTAHCGKIGSSKIHMLPSENIQNQYRGTADAVYKNIKFIDSFKPSDVLILSGDHIYEMDYREMLAFHNETDAAVTIASTPVTVREVHRFELLNAEENGRVSGFEEKLLKPQGDIASMGIYIFKWSALKKYLLVNSKRGRAQHDFGKDIIPEMLSSGESVYTYRFKGYWRDVGTVETLWEANMDQLDEPVSHMIGKEWKLPYVSESQNMLSSNAKVHKSIMSGGCTISGQVEHSVLGDSVTIGQGTKIINSVIMPNVYIGNNVKISNAIIGTRAIIMDGTEIGTEYGSDFFIDHQVCSRGISLIAPWLYIAEDMCFQENSHIYKGLLDKYNNVDDEMNKRVYQHVYSYEWTV